MEKKEEESLEDIEVNFAFVCFGKIRDFIAIKDFIAQYTMARLIYQKKSLDFLYIKKGSEENGKVDPRHI